MKKLGALVASAAFVLLCAPGIVSAQATSPPTKLQKVGDHWTAWNPPPAGPNDHIIVRGDTLWDLANAWFGDPFLWPQIWDENRYILDSHWIYPGDPLVRPGQPTVVPEVGLPPVADARPDRPETDRRPKQRALTPAATESEIYCSGSIVESPESSALRVAASANERLGLGQGDVIYLSHGRDFGLRPGDRFSIVRQTHEVLHPASRAPIGTHIRRLGRARVLIVHDESATATIDFACDAIEAGDELMPWREVPVPMLSALPPFDRWDAEPSGGPAGQIVEVRDRVSAAGEGHLIFTDLGESSGVAPGDLITLYRDQERDARTVYQAVERTTLPRTMLGRAIVLTVNRRTSLARIVSSVQESFVGDQVEIAR